MDGQIEEGNKQINDKTTETTHYHHHHININIVVG